jgi:hypothetical protein
MYRSDSQTINILETLHGEGLEWGLLSIIDVNSTDEPCSLQEAMVSPEALKWLATCNYGQQICISSQTRSEWQPHRMESSKGYSAVYSIDYNKTAAPTM